LAFPGEGDHPNFFGGSIPHALVALSVCSQPAEVYLADWPMIARIELPIGDQP